MTPLTDEFAPLASGGEPLTTTATAIVVVTPVSAPVVPAPDESAWAPVGFSPAMIESKGSSISPLAAPARSVVSPVLAASSGRPVPAAVAAPLRKGTAALAESPSAGTPQAVVWDWMRRAGQLLGRGGQRLLGSARAGVGSGAARLRELSPRLRELENRLSWPVDLRTAIPWLGGAALLLIVVLLTAYSCGVRTKQRNARPRGAAVVMPPASRAALQSGAAVPPQDAR